MFVASTPGTVILASLAVMVGGAGAPPDGLRICTTRAPFSVPRSIDDMSELGQWLLLSMFVYILSYDYTHVYVFVYASMNLFIP